MPLKKFISILFILSCTISSIAQPADDEKLRAAIMDPNVDIEEMMEIMAKDFPELLDPVVGAKKDYEKANQVTNATETGEYYQQLGRQFLKQKNYTQAIIYLEKSLSATKKKLGNLERHPQYTPTYKDLGDAYQGKGEVDEALIIYQKGLRSNAASFNDEDLLSNPSSDDMISPMLSIPIFEAKGNLLRQSDREQNKLLASLMAYERAIEILEDACNKYRSEYSKLHLGEQVIKMAENGIHVARQLHRLTRNEQYKTKMFALADKGKAMALRSALLDAKANGLNSIPPEMLRRERGLKIQLANLKEQLQSKVNRNRSTKNTDKNIFKISQALLFLQDSLKTYYPEYEFLKSSSPTLASDSLQLFLRNRNAAIVEYFFGKKRSYAFVITGDHFFVEQLEDVEYIKETVLSIRKQIQSMSFRTDEQTDYENFVRDASSLYSLVLESPLKNIDSSVENLIIIPDGALWLMPFEIMLYDQATTNEVNFSTNNLPYLLNKYALTYAHSSRLVMENNTYNNASTSIPFLGYAPKFRGRTDVAVRSCFESGVELAELQHSEIELENVSSKFNGEANFGPMATRSSFMGTADQAEIIHLSTHACTNNDDPMDSRIFFSDNDYINTEDIYTLQLNAKMAMLSACQTGLGKVYNGEGMISLARAFQHAGCPSVTMSLWSVADGATSEMTTLYYDYLTNGYTKSKALQQAKLDFINSQSAKKQHPFFWAGFVHLGDFRPLDSSGGGNGMFYILCFGAVLLVGGLLSKKKR